MFNILAFDCDDVGVLKVIYLVKTALEIIKIVVPILFIVMAMVDAIKNVISSAGMDMKILKRIFMKLLAGVCVFLVPTVINIVLSILGQSNYTIGTCWNNATSDVLNQQSSDEENTKVEISSEKILKALATRKELTEEWEND